MQRSRNSDGQQSGKQCIFCSCNDKRKDNRVRKTNLFIVLSSNNETTTWRTARDEARDSPGGN